MQLTWIEEEPVSPKNLDPPPDIRKPPPYQLPRDIPIEYKAGPHTYRGYDDDCVHDHDDQLGVGCLLSKFEIPFKRLSGIERVIEI